MRLASSSKPSLENVQHRLRRKHINLYALSRLPVSDLALRLFISFRQLWQKLGERLLRQLLGSCLCPTLASQKMKTATFKHPILLQPRYDQSVHRNPAWKQPTRRVFIVTKAQAPPPTTCETGGHSCEFRTSEAGGEINLADREPARRKSSLTIPGARRRRQVHQACHS